MTEFAVDPKELSREVDAYLEFWNVVNEPDYFQPSIENYRRVLVDRGWPPRVAQESATWGLAGLVRKLCRPCAEQLVEGYKPRPKCDECDKVRRD